ncbi:uncharacterized protein Z518_06993 [Rhinocladiella mackenziei CBS 650.93]|uniref:Rhinocladiella mackenziei CBS 650.93 unplaced genomic scaffold supercont1.5, whole genome shotgun sequence n=1 Tax=Rhinocladiella mackenziei CBS 650.93 TaxID=1442369 RepID=A0A0D2IJL0_9EURO|nr:uncharacterized protein Z518_06993 [Rhinocladiella mackenziei CBS 650.93]KIX03441.1 hypothetical protein Z518_06993 [Rhinocladiella mackenziei CBS 650.93]
MANLSVDSKASGDNANHDIAQHDDEKQRFVPCSFVSFHFFVGNRGDRDIPQGRCLTGFRGVLGLSSKNNGILSLTLEYMMRIPPEETQFSPRILLRPQIKLPKMFPSDKNELNEIVLWHIDLTDMNILVDDDGKAH